MAVLTTKQRKALPKSKFVFPAKAPGPGSYPVPDPAHARAALQMGAKFASPNALSTIKAKVGKKFPSIGRRGKKLRIIGG